MIQFPNKKYQIIYADPAWSYRDKARAGKRGAAFKYPTQNDDWIAQLPVRDIADTNCALFLWVTMPKLFDSKRIIEAWGFEPKTFEYKFEYKTAGFVWVKRNKRNLATWFWGMGNWTRSNPELCLLAVKGKVKRISASVHSIIEAPVGKHSQKPPETRDRIIELLGDLPRIELFARERTPGWDVWGNEV